MNKKKAARLADKQQLAIHASELHGDRGHQVISQILEADADSCESIPDAIARARTVTSFSLLAVLASCIL